MTDLQEIDKLEQLYRENPTQWFAMRSMRSGE